MLELFKSSGLGKLDLNVKGQKVLQGDTVYGVWEHEEGNKYFLSAARLYYKGEEDLSYGGRGVAGGIVTKKGDVLTGTFNIKIEGPDGKALKRLKSEVRLEKQTREGLEVELPEIPNDFVCIHSDVSNLLRYPPGKRTTIVSPSTILVTLPFGDRWLQ